MCLFVMKTAGVLDPRRRFLFKLVHFISITSLPLVAYWLHGRTRFCVASGGNGGRESGRAGHSGALCPDATS